MIGEIVAHGRTTKDRRALDRHLWKMPGQTPRLVEMTHLAAATTDEAMQVMQALRGASRARIGFWHIVVSPRQILDPAQTRASIVAILAEFSAEAHPRLVWIHADKVRAKVGGASTHIHLVLGHVGPTFRALDMRAAVPRLEKVMRILEHRLGEEATHGRYHRSVLDALVAEGREANAAWLRSAVGDTAILPRSRMTRARRAAAARAGIDLPALIATIERQWTESRDGADFCDGLEREGLALEPGRADGSWVVRQGDFLIGALDRMLRLSRDEINAHLTTSTEKTNDRQFDSEHSTTEARPGSDGAASGGRFVQNGSDNPNGRRLVSKRRDDEDAGHESGRNEWRDSGTPEVRRRESRRRNHGTPHRGTRRTALDAGPHRGAAGSDRDEAHLGTLIFFARLNGDRRAQALLDRARLLTQEGRDAARGRLAQQLSVLLARLSRPPAELTTGQRRDLALVRTEVAARDAHRATALERREHRKHQVERALQLLNENQAWVRHGSRPLLAAAARSFALSRSDDVHDQDADTDNAESDDDGFSFRAGP